MIKRRKTPSVKIGRITIGSAHPIAIQSMTNTQTSDVSKTVAQIKQLVDAGSEIVRLTIDNERAMVAIPEIVSQLRKNSYSTPIIGDFHYNGHALLKKFPKSAKALDKYRINPGNVNKSATQNDPFSEIIKIAIKNKKPVRIGVNSGSLDERMLERLHVQNKKSKIKKTSHQILCNAMVQSAIQNAKKAEKLGLPKNMIILSVKMSDAQDTIAAYEALSKKCDYALHLGVTEAGSELQGVITSACALSILLQKGIGDTIRISLTPRKNIPRSQEVTCCQTLLQAMKFRFFSPAVISCPGCGRTENQYFESLAESIRQHIKQKLPAWKTKFPKVVELKIAIMGCVVNGPGESQHADIGISLPGRGEKKTAVVYVDGKLFRNLSGKTIKTEFIQILEQYIQNRYR
ncbi:MAG: flavodoxin-dependent (E)-4-hydroxy-3-methylbut-2-enyl-diphosphate synthase [Candidatus Omnitrophica bacterium]|nr:flavodoxin-dependent (E)-4-hydroxy-3-methylbut-2-enyl-diphosphate synthase [Candidatus Omnitrophota bacterium]